MAKKEISFEQAMERLEEIVAKMESGKSPLDESFGLFEEGTKLLAFCSKELDRAEKKVKLLAKDGELEDFDLGDD